MRSDDFQRKKMAAVIIIKSPCNHNKILARQTGAYRAEICHVIGPLKGPCHPILGNLGTDQLVIELTELSQ